MLETRDLSYKKVRNVPLKSPVAIGGFFIHFLQRRFSEGQGTDPWVWQDALADTAIVIEAGGTVENEIRNKKPALWVNAGPLRIDTLVIGDRGTELLNISAKLSQARCNMNVTINAESTRRAEAHGLAWIAASSLAAAQDDIKRKYEFVSMGPFNVEPPMPNIKDQEMFVASVTFGLSYDISWKWADVQTFISEIEVSLNLNGAQSEAEYLTNLYIKR